MCDCDNKEQLDRIEAKIDQIVNVVVGTINDLKSHPMFRAMVK